MRKILVILLWCGSTFWGFTQSPDPLDPPKPLHVFASYFQWGKEYAVRNGFYSMESLYLEWDATRQGVGLELLDFRYSLLPFTSIGISALLYTIFGDEGQEGIFNVGITIHAGLILPITSWIQFFADGVLEMGRNDGGGILVQTEWVSLNPGYDLGIAFDFGTIGFDLKYKGTWLPDNRYINALGFGYTWNFWRN
jgi:hypothetical protein